MPQIINTNIMSLNSQRQLNKSQLMQNEAMERLSSGLRVNSAKDDAAGLAIATGMESQVRGINQAIRNANDGISMSQTAEGAMDEMTNILQRIRELSIQAANDTNSATNRASIQLEVDQLYDEIDRIATTTQFNGVNVLDGSVGSTTLQIGANAGENLTFSIDSVTTRDLNLNAVSGLGELNGGRVNNTVATLVDEVAINGVGLAGIAAPAANRAVLMETEINSKSGITGVSASAYNVVEGVGNQSGVTANLVVNTVAIPPTGSMSELVDTINRDVPGVVASIGSNGSLVMANDTGTDIVIGGGGSEVGMVDDTYNGFIALSSSDQSPIELGLGTAATASAAQLQQFGFNLAEGSDKVTGGEVTNGVIAGSDGIQINGVDLGAVSGTSAADKAFAINQLTSETGVTASATTEARYEVIFPGATGATLTINGNAISLAGDVSLDDVVDAINTSGIQGVVASADQATGTMILTSQSGGDIDIQTNAANSLDDGGGALAVNTSDVTRGSITLTGQDGKDVSVTSNASSEALKDAALGKLGLVDFGGSGTALGTGLSVLTVANAENTIDRIDSALQKISNARAGLGAVQNRLGSTISNLANVSQNLSASKSRIVDADFAAETSKLSKAQVLQQAGTAMLTQANASTQNVLSLLQG